MILLLINKDFRPSFAYDTVNILNNLPDGILQFKIKTLTVLQSLSTVVSVLGIPGPEPFHVSGYMMYKLNILNSILKKR